MTDDEPMPTQETGWHEYWDRTPEAAAYRGGGPQEQVLGDFWCGIFAELDQRLPGALVVDLACGNGAVFRSVTSAAGGETPFLVGVDRSSAALGELRARFPQAGAVLADLRAVPFGDGAFQLVASQFGVEYAGLEGVEQALRLVARGGMLALVLHLKDGAMYRENIANRAAVDRLRDSSLLPAMRNYFEAFDAVGRGRGSRPRLHDCASTLRAALGATAALLSQAGRDVAGGMISRLYQDALHMAGRPGAFDAREVITWAERNAAENDAYARRMSAMIAVSLGEEQMGEIVERASRRGLQPRRRERLVMGARGEPAAWVLLCERPSGGGARS